MNSREVEYYRKKFNFFIKHKESEHFNRFDYSLKALKVFQESIVFEEYQNNSDYIKILKIEAIKNQKYELAALLRDLERHGIGFFQVFERNLIVEKQ
jgi:hypothetical protein